MTREVTTWRKAVQIITTDKATGDYLYLLLRAFQGDPIPDSSVFDVELSGGAWAANIPAKKVFADIIDEFNQGGHPKVLLDAGKSILEIDALRAVITVAHYDLYPDDGLRILQPSALSDLIAASGYTRA